VGTAGPRARAATDPRLGAQLERSPLLAGASVAVLVFPAVCQARSGTCRADPRPLDSGHGGQPPSRVTGGPGVRPGDMRSAAFSPWRARVIAREWATVREQVAIDSPAEFEDTP
jgi:hypothetical protein